MSVKAIAVCRPHRMCRRYRYDILCKGAKLPIITRGVGAFQEPREGSVAICEAYLEYTKPRLEIMRILCMVHVEMCGM